MTIDMTQNRVPYGLLTDAERAALHEHWKAGGVVEHHCDGVWFKYAPSWLYNVVYRTVPLPKTQDVIAWEKLPDWANKGEEDMSEPSGTDARLDRIEELEAKLAKAVDWFETIRDRAKGDYMAHTYYLDALAALATIEKSNAP